MEKNKIHILVVDDDDRIRGLLKEYLNDNHYIVSTAENAIGAKLQLTQFYFDLIVIYIHYFFFLLKLKKKVLQLID